MALNAHSSSNKFLFLLAILLLFVAFHQHWSPLSDLCHPLLAAHHVPGATLLVVIAFLSTLHFLSRPLPIYLVDFACAKPPAKHKITRSTFLDVTTNLGVFNERSTDFQSKIIWRSGLGDATHVPTTFLTTPPDLSTSAATAETETVLYDALDSLFAKTRVDPSNVSILVVNCSIFNPTPSLSSMIVNRYHMRADVKTFNLAGMGCSAGVIAVDLAKNLLKSNPNSLAVVVSTENITVNWYFGNDRSMLLANCIFRMGCGAVLLSNRSSDKARSKYQLVHTLRTHKGASDKCYNCVNQKEDEEGKTAVSLGKELMEVAGDALTTNITTLGPLVLPLTEQFKFFLAFVGRRMLKMKKMRTYVPDFKKAFEHFCIHAGGRAVLDAMQKNLRLSEWHMEPSRMALHRFGNTSSSSLWYELAYVEAKGRVRKGDRVWQIAFGSGFKCNSAVWRALRAVDGCDGSWVDSVGRYPMKT